MAFLTKVLVLRLSCDLIIPTISQPPPKKMPIKTKDDEECEDEKYVECKDKEYEQMLPRFERIVSF